MNIFAYFQSTIATEDDIIHVENTTRQLFGASAIANPLYVFPHAYLRQYWTSALSKHFACIGLASFVTFPKFQQLLQIELCKDPMRFLTRNERLVMASFLLQDSRAQALIAQIEQWTNANRAEPEYFAQYAPRLLQMLDQCIVFMHSAQEDTVNTEDRTRFIHALQTLCVLYDTLLAQYNCVDVAVLTYRLYLLQQEYTSKSNAITANTTKTSTIKQCKIAERTFFSNYNVQILFPELLSPLHKLWLEYFGLCLTHIEKEENGSITEYKNREEVTHHATPLFTYEEVSFSLITEAAHAHIALPAHLQHTAGTQDVETHKPSLHVYNNVAQELEAIFSAIAILLSDGTHPEDIALSVCSASATMDEELVSLANKYQIPISLSSNSSGLPRQFVNSVQATIQSNFSPPILQQLLLEEAFPWKEREKHLVLITIGMKQSCFNDSSLSRWKYLLRQHDFSHNTQLAEYFTTLARDLKEISKAKSVSRLYSLLEKFVVNYFYGSFRKLGEYDSDSNNCGNALLIAIEKLLVFEKYLEMQGATQEPLQKPAQEAQSTPVFSPSPPKEYTQDSHAHTDVKHPSYSELPWNSLARMLEQANSKLNSAKYAEVQIIPFPQTLACNNKYQFICNLSQNAIVQASAYRSIFNDFLAQQYDSSTVRQLYEEYRTHLLHCIDHTEQHANSCLYLSGSEQGLEKVQSLPIYWNTVEVVQEAPDIWQAEAQYWKSLQQINSGSSPNLLPNLLLAREQVEGLKHQALLKLDANKSSILFHGLDKMLFTKLLAHREYRIPVTSLSSIFNPSQFLLEHILDARPLMEEWSLSMQEHRTWGSLYHVLLEEGIHNSLDYVASTKPNIHADKSDVAPLDLEAETSHTQEYLLSLIKRHRIHRYMWDSYLESLAQFPLVEHIDALVSILQAESPSNFSTEKSFSYGINNLLDILLSEQGATEQAHFTSLKQFFETMAISGKIDLVYAKDQNLTKIIDYKYKPRDSYLNSLYLLFQPWIYYLCMNSTYILQGALSNGLSIFNSLNHIAEGQAVDNSLNASAQEAMALEQLCVASIYFTTEDPKSTKVQYPQKANARQKKTNQYIYTLMQSFGSTLLFAMQRFSDLYKGELYLPTLDDSLQEEIIARLSPEPSFSTKLILREGCYAYIK